MFPPASIIEVTKVSRLDKVVETPSRFVDSFCNELDKEDNSVSTEVNWL